MGDIVGGISWNAVLSTSAALYALSIAVFLVLENRSPQSTFAWLFILLIVPVVGVVLYVMFGRNWHAFSRERFLTHITEGSALAHRSADLIARQPELLATLETLPKAEYWRLGAMLWASGRAPLTLHNQLEILQNASEKYPRLIADIEAAAESIHMVYYEWASDAFTGNLAQILARKVSEGVDVRILYDPVGSFFMLSFEYLRRIRRAGIRMHPFSPLYRVHALSYRNHRKIVVIDGKVAYCGGLNMTEKDLTGPKGFTGWRDTHARVVGGASVVLQGVFATMWQNTTGENLFDDRHFPEPPPAEDGVPVQVVSAGPDSRWRVIRQSYLAMIAMADHHVYIQSPFLILDESLAEAMKTAALAGIDVRLMIAPRGAEYSPAYRAGMTYAAEMAEAGVQVLLYQGDYFHPKTVAVDSRICSIGSANMDIRSFAIDYETNLVIYDEKITRELEADFMEDARRTELFSVAKYRSGSLPSRFLDSTMRLCSPLL